MNNVTIDEVKDILKCSIDETTNMNEAIERTLQHIYLKGWNDAENLQNTSIEEVLDKIRVEIDQYLFQNEFGSAYRKEVSQIIDKYKVEGSNKE